MGAPGEQGGGKGGESEEEGRITRALGAARLPAWAAGSSSGKDCPGGGMVFEQIHVDVVEAGVARVVFDHGKANEMGTAQLRELAALPGWAASHGVRAVITMSRKRTAKGTPIFVSGANVTERVGWSDGQVKAHVHHQREVLAQLRRGPFFHVIVVGGACLGWGTEYLLTGDYRIATSEASFALPETGLGILPGAGGTGELWAQIGPAHALRLGMTGERIDAPEGHRVGLVQELAADADAGFARALSLARAAATRSPTAIVAFKRALLDAIGRPMAERTAIEAAAYERCVDSGEAAIGRAAFSTSRDGGVPPWGPLVEPA